MEKIIPTITNITTGLKDEQFRKHISNFFIELKNVITPPMKSLLTSVFQIFIEVASKNSSKLMGIITTTMSSFPPAALIFDIASMADVGVNTMISGLKLADASTNNFAEIQGKFPSVLKELENAKTRLSEVGLDTSKIVETVQNAKKQATDRIGLKNIDSKMLTDKTKEFTDSIKHSVKSTAKGIVNLLHNTSITDENMYEAKKTELQTLQSSEPKNEVAINELVNDIENYEKNKAIKNEISNENGKIIDRTKNILNKEGYNVDKEVEQIKRAEDKAKQMVSTASNNAKAIATSGFNLGKSFISEFKKPSGLQQQKQAGGSIKKIHNLSRKITSRIIKSLKDFSNTDRIQHRNKTKRYNKLHKQTKKHRKYKK